MDSCFAASMKPQVLTMMASALAGSLSSSKPSRTSTPSISSASTRFFAQPSDTIPILIPTLPYSSLSLSSL